MSRNREIAEVILDIFNKVYSGYMKVHIYGSRASSLATSDNADLDLFIDTSKNQRPINMIELENWLLNGVCRYMVEKDGTNWSKVTPILTCRTPILKVVHLPTQIQCDITCLSSLGINNTQLMNLYLKNIPVLRQLIIVLREWLIEFHFSKDITNYALSMLVIFYLQVRSYAPSVNELNFQCSDVKLDVTGYDYVNYENVDYEQFRVKSMKGLGLTDLLQDFFQYYCDFEFETNVICPLLGRTVKRKLFKDKPKKLPPEMHRYVERTQKGEEIFKTETAMCVQDPIDLAHNLTKSTKKMVVHNFADKCFTASKTLQTLN